MALDTQIKTQLQTYLQMLKEPVDLVASLDDSAGAKEMLALLEEFSTSFLTTGLIEGIG